MRDRIAADVLAAVLGGQKNDGSDTPDGNKMLAHLFDGR